MKVLLVEQSDLASATSSASTKLIHGGLRYLELFEFRLVRESLIERERLLGIAPHIIRPMQFVLPHVAGLRPRWQIRLGLFFYDHIGGRKRLPASRAVRLDRGALRRRAEARARARIRLFGLLGRRQPAGGVERDGCRRARRVDPTRTGLFRATGRQTGGWPVASDEQHPDDPSRFRRARS